MEASGQRHAPAALLPGKNQYPLYRKLGRPQGQSGMVRKVLPPPGFDPRTVQPVASRYPGPCIRKVQIKMWDVLYEARLQTNGANSFALSSKIFPTHITTQRNLSENNACFKARFRRAPTFILPASPRCRRNCRMSKAHKQACTKENGTQ